MPQIGRALAHIRGWNSPADRLFAPALVAVTTSPASPVRPRTSSSPRKASRLASDVTRETCRNVCEPVEKGLVGLVSGPGCPRGVLVKSGLGQPSPQPLSDVATAPRGLVQPGGIEPPTFGSTIRCSASSYVRVQGFWARLPTSGLCRSVRSDGIQRHGMGDGALRRRSIKLLCAGWRPHSVFRLGAGPV
jgi:hypothetical protein